MFTFEESNERLLDLLPKEQYDEVMNQEYCDIECVFLGFVDTYEYLSYLIPKHYAIIDLGCAYNAQCYFFKNHKIYIAVDESKRLKRFQSDNCIIYINDIDNFILNDLPILQFNLKETFAICNYVPMKDYNLIKQTFDNLYIYYPHGSEKQLLQI